MKTRLAISDLQQKLTKDDMLIKYHLLDIYNAQNKFKQTKKSSTVCTKLYQPPNLTELSTISKNKSSLFRQNQDSENKTIPLPHFGTNKPAQEVYFESTYDMPRRSHPAAHRSTDYHFTGASFKTNPTIQNLTYQ